VMVLPVALPAARVVVVVDAAKAVVVAKVTSVVAVPLVVVRITRRSTPATKVRSLAWALKRWSMIDERFHWTFNCST
jgi:hypothetical protein